MFGLPHVTLQQNECTSSSFLITVTLSEGQGHSHWYQNVEFTHAYHHTTFEWNQFTSVQTQVNLEHILFYITEIELSPLNTNQVHTHMHANPHMYTNTHTHTKTNMSLNRDQQVMVAYQISSNQTVKFARKKSAEVCFLTSYITVTLNEGQSRSHWYQSIQFCGVYHHNEFERNY